MRKILFACSILLSFVLNSQTNCSNAQPFCAGGVGGLTFPATVNGPPAQAGPNYGCLGSEPNPAWYYLQVGQSGNLIISIAGQIGNGPGQDVDFICWGPFNSLAGCCNSLTLGNIVDCSYSANYTETCTIPFGVAGQYYMVLITNFANVPQNIVFNQIGGTGSTNCGLLLNSSNICAGQTATIVANNQSNLGNPTFSLNPGALTSPNPTFVVSPTVTTTYTVYVTGTNNQNVIVTQTAVTTVTVNPNPSAAPTLTQATCQNSVNSVNLNLTFNPAAPVPNYTVAWNPVPPGVVSPTQTIANNLVAGTTNVTITAAGGCTAIVSFVMNPIPPVCDFTISPPGGTYSITCLNSSISLTAAPANYTYTWISPTNPTLTGSTQTFTNPGNYTITGTDPVGGCSSTQTMAIGINTLTPTNSVSPTGQTITCSATTAVTFSGTVLNLTVNVQHDWYSPLNPLPGGAPISTSNNTISILSGVIPPGVYTLVTTNLVNGCTATKTVNVVSLDAWPTFGINSSTNYSVGCIPLNQTTLSITNPVSTQTPPATCSYTFLPPGFVGVVPNGSLGVNASTITTLPGTWTVMVNDNSNNCRTILTVPIIQNTIAPNVAAVLLTQTLTCKSPTILATGTSSTANTVVSWEKPLAPPSVPNSTITVGPGTGPNTSTTSLTYANYTVVATNSVNACISTSVVIISQNFKKPVSSPTLSSGTPLGIYCNVGTNPAILTTGASAPGSGVPNAFAANPCWAGPAPQTTICGASSYSCFIAGVYSLTIEDSYNGCTATNTFIITDKTQPPVITTPAATATLDCGALYATLNIALTGTMIGGPKYLVKQYPANAAFQPTNATVFDPSNPSLSGTSSSSISVSLLGTYVYIVSNTLTGCTANGTFNVVGGGLNADFDISPPTGYAPLGVSFNNTSSSSLNSSSITSVWSFGNGSTQTTTTNLPTQALYVSPGTYTVMLLISKGACLDTAFKTVKVEVPSKLDIPNVFTPNGDGNNDVFFLKTANLSEITASIFDRWGNKVYDVTSSSGNIAWDGKSLDGKDCSPGVYFYIIKATGRDGADYNTKGNVTLFR